VLPYISLLTVSLHYNVLLYTELLYDGKRRVIVFGPTVVDYTVLIARSCLRGNANP
jgi:hypothetical protein